MPTVYDEITEGKIWIRATLLADTAFQATNATGVWDHPAPRSQSFPYVTVQAQYDSDDLTLVGSHILWTEIPYLIRAWDEHEDELSVSPISAAVKDALHGRFGATTNAIIVSCRRKRPYRGFELLDTVQYISLGGIYVLQIRPKS